jgi:hypothetical protein
MENSFHVNITIVVHVTDYTKCEEYTNYYKQGRAAAFSGYKELEEYDTSIGGVPASIMEYTIPYNNTYLQNIFAIFVKDDIGYIIHYEAPAEFHDQYLDAFNLVISTFKFTMPFAPVQETPLSVSWRNEGIVEKTEFTGRKAWVSGHGTYEVLEIRVLIPVGTLGNEAKTQALQERLVMDIVPPNNVDVVIITLCEQTKSGIITQSETSSRGFPVTGMKEINQEVWMHLLNQCGCPSE